MHYHHGFFADAPPAGIGIGFDTAMDRAVEALFPSVGAGRRVLDVGAGWCGPLAMLEDSNNCSVVGVTISSAQSVLSPVMLIYSNFPCRLA